jgi:RNA polymerase sigma-70 factor (ECF subfamily)
VRTHHDADEIAQETFVKAFEALPSFRGDAEFRTWLYRIAMNLSLNSLKAARRRRETRAGDQDVARITGEDGLQTVQQRELAGHIERALHELPTMQRATVMLRHIHGLSTRQVSEILQCTEGTVKTHLFRGLEKLRKSLKYLDGEAL